MAPQWGLELAPSKQAEELTTNQKLYAARAEVVEAMPTIIQAMIAKAKEGSYLHAKFLLEFASGEDDAQAGRGESGESLAALLMKELRAGSGEDEPTG